MKKFIRFTDKLGENIYVNSYQVSKVTENDKDNTLTCLFLSGSQIPINIKGNVNEVIRMLEEEKAVVIQTPISEVTPNRKNREVNAEKKGM